MKRFIGPCPTLFDWCAVLGVIGMGYIPWTLKGFYLIFYSIFVICVGFNYPVLKKMRAGSLTLITLIGLSSVFLHSFYYAPKSITIAYINTMMLMEGFAYLFFGCMLLYTLATKGRNLRLFLITLPIAGISSVKYALHGSQISVVMAFAVGILVYLTYKRRFLLLGVMVCLTLCGIALNYNYIVWKFSSRPDTWAELYRIAMQHPFVGAGVNNFIGGDKNMVLIYNDTRTVIMNYLFRSNDYLNIATAYGFPILLAIGLFIKDGIIRFKNSWLIAPFIAICALCFVQITMFWADKALMVLGGLGLMYSEN